MATPRVHTSSRQGQLTRQRSPSRSQNGDEDFVAIDSDLGDDEPPGTGLEDGPRLRAHGAINYSEETSDSDELERTSGTTRIARENTTRQSIVRITGSKRQRLSNHSRASPKPARAKKGSKAVSSKTAKPVLPHKQNTVIRSDGKIPDWTALPYFVLLNIFTFAYNTLQDNSHDTQASINWVIKAARTCRLFAEPALTAFYRSPALRNNVHPHHLLDLVSRPKEELSFDYGIKIRRLDLDVSSLAYSAPSRGRPDLAALVPRIPKLKSISIYHEMDERPVFLPSINSSPIWKYPPQLFEALQQNGTRLDEWRWHTRLFSVPPQEQSQWLKGIHESSPFQSLKKLIMIHFGQYAGSGPAISDFSTALVPLARLRSLELLFCDTITPKKRPPHEEPLPLPPSLERLCLKYCFISTPTLEQTLLEQGGNMKELVLESNPFINSNFLHYLKDSCPKLELIRFDNSLWGKDRIFFTHGALTHHETSGGKEAQNPEWPSTLREIDLTIRWSKGAEAEKFLNSLIDAAPTLPHLRILILKATVDIEWRQRAIFRDTWTGRLERVFLRKDVKPPDPHLGSFAAYRDWKLRNSRESKKSSDSRVPKEAPARGLRSREPVSADNATKQGSPPVHVHGMCKVVDIRMDNIRPARDQYTEADFRDSEPSDDSDFVAD